MVLLEATFRQLLSERKPWGPEKEKGTPESLDGPPSCLVLTAYWGGNPKMGPGHLPSKRVVNAQGRAARTAGGESWGEVSGGRWRRSYRGWGGYGHWRELHPGMRGGRSPAGRCWAQGSTQLIWTLEEAGTGDWARLSPLPQPRQDGTLIPKCLRSCSRNTNVSTVWGMRRMPAGKRPL